MFGVALRRRSGLAAVALVISGASGQAREFEFTPRIFAGETFTSNVRQAPHGAEQADLVTQIGPGFSVKEKGARTELNLNYDVEQLLYLNASDKDGLRQSLGGFGRAELIDEFLFVDSSARIYQLYGDAQQGSLPTTTGLSQTGIPGSTTSVTANNNRTEARTFTFSPYVRERLGSVADAELRYRFGSSSTGSSSLGDAISNDVSLVVQKRPELGGLGWAAQYAESHADRSGTALTPAGTTVGNLSTEMRSERLDFQYVFVPGWAGVAAIGYDEVKDPTLRSNTSGPSWDTGVEWRPGRDSYVRLTIGERYNGQDVGFEAKTPIGGYTTLRAEFSRTFQTSQSALIQDTSQLGLDQRTNLIDTRTGLPVPPGEQSFGLTNQAFRRDRLTATVNSTRGRTGYNGAVVYEERKVDAGTGSQTLAGGTVGWTRRLTPFLGLTTALDYQRITVATDASADNVYGATVGLSYRVAPTVNTQLGVRHSERESPTASRSIRESVVTVQLVKSF